MNMSYRLAFCKTIAQLMSPTPETEVTSMIIASNTCKNDTRHNIPRDTDKSI